MHGGYDDAHNYGRVGSRQDQTIQRWCRMVERLAARLHWHLWGVLLWLVRRPSMRYVPLPYPSISSIKQWKLQAQTMEDAGILPKGSILKAELNQHFNATAMADCIWLRNRMGLRYAFLEDPVLTGMMAGRAAKGLTARVKSQAIAEAKEKAQAAMKDGTAEQEARALIGPRGGLPTLRSDLVKLAALLHVPLEDKMTVPQIKEKVKPMVDLLKSKPTTSPSKASSSTTPV